MGKQKEPLWTKAYVTALAIMFAVSITTNMLFSTLSIYAKGMTSSDYYAGLLASAFTLAALTTRGFMGKLFDVLSLKKVLLLGVIISWVASAGYILSTDQTILVGLRIIHGIGFGIASTAAATFITSSLPKSRLLEGVGYSGMVGTVSMALGPSIVLSITNSDYRLFDRAFILTFMITAISLVGAFSLKDKTKDKKTDKLRGDESVLTVQHKLGLLTLIPVSISLIVAFSQSSVSTFLSVYALEKQLGNISMYFMLYAIASFLSRLITSQVVGWFTEKKVIIGSIIVLCLCFLGISLTNSAYILFALAIPYGFASGFLSPIFNVRILNSVPEEKQGTANALYYASIDAGLGVGAIVWSGVANSFGYGNTFIIASVLMVACLFYFITMNKRFSIR